MKKAKIMLMSIAILAIVAGALAFKAKTYGTFVCTAEFAPGRTTCPDLIQTSTNVLTGDLSVVYTDRINGRVIDAESDCETATACTPIYVQDQP